MPCAALDRSVTVTSTSAARTAFQSSATLSGSSEQELRPSTGATQQRNRYFLHEKYATPISPSTAGTHVENLYRKLGVSTRAAAALIASKWGLVN